MIIPRQTTNYTCGPVSLLAATTLSGTRLDLSEINLASLLDTTPGAGDTDNALMADFAHKHLPVASMGAENWNGSQLAIANILNPDSGAGRYVVLLSEKDCAITYYDPYGKVVRLPRDALQWRSADGQHTNWSINLTPPSPDARDITPARHTFILADDKATLLPEMDTTLLIEAETLERGHSCTWHLDTSIVTEGDRLFLDGVPVWDGDIVWVRSDPVNSVRYYEMLRRLLSVRGVFLNTPEAILTCHDKHMAGEFRKDRFTVSSLEAMAVVWRKMHWRGHRKVAIKPPSRFGGEGISFAASLDEAMAHTQHLLPDSGYVIVEPYIPEPGRPHVDTRVLVCDGEVIGILDRVGKETGALCNLHQGAMARANAGLSLTRQGLLEKAITKLKRYDIFLAGIDFLEDEITEINVSCPSTVRQINQVMGAKIETTIVQMANRVADEKTKSFREMT